MKPMADDPGRYARERLMVARAKLPTQLRLHEELGKGANNKVFRATLFGQDCVLRAPRRGSDTQQRGSAMWEFRHTLKASQLGVGPALYQAWCARHAHEEWPSGLYLVTERMPHDLETVLSEDAALRPLAVARRDDIGAAAAACLHKLAEARIFVFDLKPGNIVVDGLEGECRDARARCARARPRRMSRPRRGRASSRAHFASGAGRRRGRRRRDAHIDLPAPPRADERRARGRRRGGRPRRARPLGVMLVVLAATTTHQLRADRRHNRTDARERVAPPLCAPRRAVPRVGARLRPRAHPARPPHGRGARRAPPLPRPARRGTAHPPFARAVALRPRSRSAAAPSSPRIAGQKMHRVSAGAMPTRPDRA